MLLARFCFNLGGVGSSLVQAYIPVYWTESPTRALEGTNSVGCSKLALDMNVARPAISTIIRTCWVLSSFVVAISSEIIVLGQAAFTADPGVARKMAPVSRVLF